MGVKDVISMVSTVLVKHIWREISRPFKFISLTPFPKRTLITTEPQVTIDVSDHDLESPMEESKRIHTQVETADDMPSESRSHEEIKKIEEFVDADDMLLESRKSIMKQVLLALKNPQVNRITVFGGGVSTMGGTGKTMLVKKVASRVAEEKLFDAVVSATVTRIPNIPRIQGEIANGLGFKFSQMDISPSERANILRHRLRKKQKVLLILYDIWDNIHPEEVGIPLDNGLKILMTSPYEDALSNGMGTKSNFELDLLEEGEAWSLFEKTLGHGIITDSTLASIAHQVANKCIGLPILLVIVATALKGADLNTWTDALKHLMRIKNNKANQVLSALELSYNILLRGEEIKSLFLLCGFFEPPSISINDLFKYARGMGLFRQSRAPGDAHNLLHKLLDDLKASTLLVKGDDNSKVRMHYVIHDFAISIACRYDRIFTTLYIDTLFKSWAFVDVRTLGKALCFHLDNIALLSKIPNSLILDLEVLVLVSPNPSLKLPKSFFGKLKYLQVLSFTNMNFPSLPSSLTFMGGLEKLCLHFCNLEDISMIGEMKNLQMLSLANSNIVQLPKQIAQLIDLQILDLTSCRDLEVIPSNVLSCLTLLEELFLGNSFNQWEVEGSNSQGKNAKLDELKHLVNLHTLDIHVRDAAMLPRGLFPGKLEKFKVFVGDVWGWSGNEASKTLKLKLNSSNQLQETGIEALLVRAEELHLHGLMSVKSILYELNDACPKMKHLHIQSVSEIQYIVTSVGTGPWLAFKRLETLFLSNLDNLEKICEDQVMEECFVNLKKLKMEFCGKIRNLLSVSMAKGLVKLQEINVSCCENMEGIVADTNKPTANHNGPIKLACLQTLTLCNLPKLRSFFMREVNASFTFQTDNKIETICDGQLTEESFANLKKLEVEFCGNVRNLFSISSAKGSMHLEEINVSYCENLEEIVVVTTKPGVGNDGLVKFPYLRKLKLCGLPKLRSKASSY